MRAVCPSLPQPIRLLAQPLCGAVQARKMPVYSLGVCAVLARFPAQFFGARDKLTDAFPGCGIGNHKPLLLSLHDRTVVLAQQTLCHRNA